MRANGKASGLNERQRHFVEEYMIDHNGTQAVIRAGYSETGASVTACRLLANPKLSGYLDARRAEMARRAEISQDWVIDSLKANHDRAMQATPVLDKDGEETGSYVYNGAVANRSLELIGKHQGMFADQVEVRMLVVNAKVTLRGRSKD